MSEGVNHKSHIPTWLKVVLFGRRPKATLVRLIVLVGAVLITFNFILLPPVHITGPSMSPTLKDGSINFVVRWAFLFREPKRGDIVAIRYSGPSIMLCKRVIGLPGETVEFVRGHVRINGKFLDEPYVK